ncbi:MAG: WXG100 family type VII secretion target [Actinomycetota bacterium]
MSLVSFPVAVASIPGEPGQIQGGARTYSSVADNLRSAADGVLSSAQATDGSWTGMSADAFRAATSLMEQRATEAASTFSEIAGVLQTYAQARGGETQVRRRDVAGLRSPRSFISSHPLW